MGRLLLSGLVQEASGGCGPAGPADSIFCASDDMGVIFEANRVGASRSADRLSVIGIDDHDFSEALGLTTVGRCPTVVRPMASEKSWSSMPITDRSFGNADAHAVAPRR